MKYISKKINLKYLIVPSFAIVFMMSFFVGNICMAFPGDPGGGSTSFESPIKYGTVEALLGQILKTVQAIVGSIAILMIVIGGLMYMTSGGDQGRVELAKKAVTAAVIGLALALAAPTFLNEIYNAMGGSADKPEVASGTLSGMITNILGILVSIIGSLSILMIVIGGVMYMTAGGDDSRAEAAKGTIKYAIVGLAVSVLAYTIVKVVAGVF